MKGRRGEREGRRERRTRATSAASRECTCPPSWSHSLRVSRMASRGRSTTTRGQGEDGGRKENRREKRWKKGEGERAGRRKRPRQDVGSCLPAGG